MAEPHRVSRRQVEDDPYAVWNEYVHLLAMSDYADLSKTQRFAHLVFWYEQEVQNGGHLQYFENQGIDRIAEVMAALRHLGADCQAEVLASAAARFSATPRERLESIEDYVAVALEAEFETMDRAFDECAVSLPDVLATFLEKHRAEFVLIID